jgi:hypothetical protein
MRRNNAMSGHGQRSFVAGLKIVLAPLAMALCLSATGVAQDQATVTGTVTDSTGAIVPGVKITVADADIGLTRDTVSNSAGDYTVAKIPLGTYSISAEAAGFQRLVRTAIEVTAGQTLRVDLQLSVGAVSQEVTVAGNTPKVDTENGALSDVVTTHQVTQLNLNGRVWMSLVTLLPGVAPLNDTNFNPLHLGFGSTQMIISMNGNRANDANVEVDGGNVQNEPGGGRNIVVFPNVDSIAEFRVTTSDYGADVGKRPGAVVEVVTKGGTREFHGTAYEFLRNDDLDANPFFINRTLHPSGDPNYQAPKTPLKWNIFGFNFGGPFYIPNHYNTDKSRTFVFWSESWARYREGTVFSAQVPSIRMRQGDFSECDPASPNYNSGIASGCVLPKNPATGLPMDTLAGAGYTLDPNAVDLMSGLVPMPNSGSFNYTSAPSLPNNYRQDNIRIDQNFSSRTTLFGRYTTEIHDYFSATSSTYNTAENHNHFPTKAGVIHLNHTFSPNLMNEVIFGWYSATIDFNAVASPTSPAGSILKPANWTAGNLFAGAATSPQTNVMPWFIVSGGLPFSFTESTGNQDVQTIHHAGTLKDNVVWTRGRHTLKFGTFFEDFKDIDYESYNPPQGKLTFSASGPLTTGNGLADAFLGRINSFVQSFGYGGPPQGGWSMWRGRMKDWENYVQDDWKVTPRLTLNLGVRYQYQWNSHDGSRPTVDSGFIPTQYSAAAEAQLNAGGFLIPGTGQIFTSHGNGLVMCGSNGVPVSCLYGYYRSINPRFGFAYDIFGDGKTSIRGGYGMYSDIGYGHGASGYLQSINPPAALTSTAYNINGYESITSGVLAPPSLYAFPEHLSRPHITQYNLTLEHEFPHNNILSVAYVGTLGRHLERDQNLNQVPLNSTTVNVPALAGSTDCDMSGSCNVQASLESAAHPSLFFAPYRGYGTINWGTYTAVSDYNSLQVNYRHTVGRGLTFQTTYTWAHSIDDSSDGDFLNGVDNFNDLSRWRGNSDFNRAQSLNLNYVYELPFFRNNANHLVKSGLGGWQLSGISTFFTGLPVITGGYGSAPFTCTENGYATGIGTNTMCNPIEPLKVDKGVINVAPYGPTMRWFNPGALAMPLQSQLPADGEPGMFGYLNRDTLWGPGRNNWDIALMKNFQLPWFRGEHSNMQFRWETFNTFNHTQFEYIQAGCSGKTPFGGACNDANNNGNGAVTGAWNPRQMQFGVKLSF